MFGKMISKDIVKHIPEVNARKDLTDDLPIFPQKSSPNVVFYIRFV